MKYIKINYFFIGLVSILLASVLWPAIHWHTGKQDSLAAIKARGVLRVSTVNSALTWLQINNQPTGMDYELAKRFADYLGVKLEVKLCPDIQSLFNDLSQGRTDILAAGLNWDPRLASQLQTGPAYYTTALQLVYRVNKSRPKSLAELNGQLAVAALSSALLQLEQLKATDYPELSWSAEPKLSQQQLLKQVAEGKLDYTIADSATISMMQRIYPNLATAFDLSSNVPVTWYLPQAGDNRLHTALYDFYRQINKQGVLARLEEKYLGHVGSFDYVDTRSFLRAVDTTLPSLKPVFQKYAQNFDWHLLAAMAWQESHWDALARSPTGVRGMMMLTKTTASSVAVNDRLNPEESIRGGSEYLQRLMQRLPGSIADDEKIWFALAAYNIGYAHLLDARQLTARQGADPDSWADVKQRLPMLSQKRFYRDTTYGYARGQEAYDYVERIRKYNISLVGYLREMKKAPAGTIPPASATETQIAMN